MTSYIPTVLVIISMVVYMVGALRSSYGPVKEIPDLRLSEFAPDLSSVPDEFTRTLKKKEQEALERMQNQQQVWDRYHEQYKEWEEAVKDAYAKRLLQGNPVTPENPLTPYEQPHQPHRPYMGYYGTYH